MRADETWSLNLNCENLKVYGPSSRKIYNQLIRYPQEIIPLMDHTFTEVFLDMFEDVEPEGRSITVSYLILQFRFILFYFILFYFIFLF